MKLSVIVPVYNERKTILRIVEAIEGVPIEKEIVIVDDGSTDGTRELIQKNFTERRGFQLAFHAKNQGKGKAVGTGVQKASGDAVIIQDADLEYDPKDYPKLIAALEEAKCNVVFGSRFLGNRKSTVFWHWAVNAFLTQLTNILFGGKLTDMETCYKLFRASTIKTMPLKSLGFEIEAEIAARLLKKKERIVEIPIAYKGRTYHEGKKIGWRDGLKAISTLFYYRFND